MKIWIAHYNDTTDGDSYRCFFLPTLGWRSLEEAKTGLLAWAEKNWEGDFPAIKWTRKSAWEDKVTGMSTKDGKHCWWLQEIDVVE